MSIKSRLPWHREYRILGLPSSLKPYPDKPVFTILEEAATKFPKNGIVQLNYKMTYPELKASVERFAAALNDLGMKQGGCVATLLPTSIQFIIADYSISRLGLIHVPCSYLEPFEILKHKFNEAKPEILICLSDNIDLALKLKKATSLRHIIFSKLDDYGTNIADLTEPEITLSHPDVSWMSGLISKTDIGLPEIKIDTENDIEILLFTGGTTGLPKGCMLTHKNIYSNSIQSSHSLGQSGLMLKGCISVLLGLPFFHSYGHLMMHTMMLLGFDILLVTEGRNVDEMIRMIRKHRPVLQVGVPAQFMKITEKDLKGSGMLCLSGSAPLPQNVQEEYEAKAGGGIMEGYGLSEMSPVTHLNTTLLKRLFGGNIPVLILNNALRLPGLKPLLRFFISIPGPRLVGRIVLFLLPFLNRLTSRNKKSRSVEHRGSIGIPAPDTDIKITDTETGRVLSWEEVLEGKTGEMLLKGPQRMLGYWPDKGSGIDDDGYIHTGDVVRVDKNGLFRIVDRTKDMIIISGYKVYSKEMEELLYKHPDVNLAAVVGVPDIYREGSERVVVYIQPKKHREKTIDENEIISYIKKYSAAYAVPLFIVFTDKMPLTEIEKIDKKAVRELAIKESKNRKSLFKK